MRTKVLSFLAPLAVVAFGLVSAASTSAIDKADAAAPVMGWKHISGSNPCLAVQECSNSGNFDCTAPDGAKLYARPISTCLVPLKRNVQ